MGLRPSLASRHTPVHSFTYCTYCYPESRRTGLGRIELLQSLSIVPSTRANGAHSRSLVRALCLFFSLFWSGQIGASGAITAAGAQLASGSPQ